LKMAGFCTMQRDVPIKTTNAFKSPLFSVLHYAEGRSD